MKFTISESDKKWIEKNFFLFIKLCGFPNHEGQQFLLNKISFPHTFAYNEIKVECVIEDLIQLFDLNDTSIQFEIFDDLRNSSGMPIEIYGEIVETELQINDDAKYLLRLSRTICNRTDRLIFSLINEFCKIKLQTFGITTEHRNDEEYFLFLTGVYFGFGVILAQRRMEIGFTSDGQWRSSWKFVSNMTDDLIIYAIALYIKIFPTHYKTWINELPRELKKPMDYALDIVSESCSIDLNKNELESEHLFFKANNYQKQNNYIKAYECYQKILELSQKANILSSACNSFGYAKIKEGLVEESIYYFQKAIQHNPFAAFANDNLGYSLIFTGETELGLSYLQKAIASGKNDKGYSLRNHGLYYLKKGDFKKARECFEAAFDNTSIPIDFIEFHYADLLFEIGDTEKGMIYLKKAVDKGEQIAIDKFKELTSYQK